MLRQLEGWQAVDGGLAPDRAERDGLRRRVERDYALARPLRVFLPHWDEVQRALRRRYISLSANYFAQAIAALDTLLEELKYEDTDPLRCHTAWQSLRQALHGINTESRDFARELRALRVDGNHPEMLADIADRLGVLHEKFFRVAAEGSAKVRERLELLRDERHDGENVRQLQWALRQREEEWSVGLGETEDERRERLDAIARDVVRELTTSSASWPITAPARGARRRRSSAWRWSTSPSVSTRRSRCACSRRRRSPRCCGVRAIWPRAASERRRAPANISGTPRARCTPRLWVQGAPSSDDGVRLERWLEHRGGSPLPLVDEEIWRKSLRPRHKPPPPPPPPVLLLADDWQPGDDPRIRELEEARARLIERLIAAGSAGGREQLESLDELRLLASFLWLPRDSSPLRRLGLRIQAPGAGGAARAVLHGPGFEVELDNYRFSATTAARQKDADTQRVAAEAAAQLSAIASGRLDRGDAPAGGRRDVPRDDAEGARRSAHHGPAGRRWRAGGRADYPAPAALLARPSYATHPLPESRPMHPAAQQSVTAATADAGGEAARTQLAILWHPGSPQYRITLARRYISRADALGGKSQKHR